MQRKLNRRLLCKFNTIHVQAKMKAEIATKTARKTQSQQQPASITSHQLCQHSWQVLQQKRQHLGCSRRECWIKSNKTEKRGMIQAEISHMEEELEGRQEQQCTWTRWTTIELKWGKILYEWSLTENTNCELCWKRGSLEHVISFCNVYLTQDRYRWRNDQLL